MSLGRSALAFTLVAVAVALGLAHLPTTLGTLETIAYHARLMLHMWGLLPRERTVAYGQAPLARRASNGSILEVQGWLSVEEFREKHLWKAPAVFRQAGTEENGFDLQCLTHGGKLSVKETMELEMGENKVNVFTDQYNDASAELMTHKEYRKLAEEAEADSSKAVPYPRAYPVNSMKSCRPVPYAMLDQYRSRAGQAAQRYIPNPDNSLLFMSYNAGTTTKMHMDVGDSLFVQAYGRKRWLLVDPEYASELKIWADTLNLVYIAGYDVHREALPAHIPIREVILHPGDILYFPPMTFHAVCNLDPVTVGVDNPAFDVPGGFLRHWFLTLGTVLNPWIPIQSVRILFRTGSWTPTGLYFDGFTKERQRREQEARQKQEEKDAEVADREGVAVQ